MLPEGTLLRITTLRRSRGVWWGRACQGLDGSIQYANILIGPPIKAYGETPYKPPLTRWSLSGEEYMEVPEWDQEFLIAQARLALLGQPNSTN